MSKQTETDFERAASEQPEAHLLADFGRFLMETKKWWMLPMLLALIAFGGLIFLSGTAAAPFVYTLF